MVLHRGVCTTSSTHAAAAPPKVGDDNLGWTWNGQQQPANDHGTCCASADIAVQVLAA
jgi:hypothetical protein